MMLNERQEQIITLLQKHHHLGVLAMQKSLKLTRARINQLINPLIEEGLVVREGRARATVYKLTEKRVPDQVFKENWELRNKVRLLEKTLEDRKIIERAKEILIAEFDILPTEAYRKLQEQSMDSGKPVREIADGILAAYEI